MSHSIGSLSKKKDDKKDDKKDEKKDDKGDKKDDDKKDDDKKGDDKKGDKGKNPSKCDKNNTHCLAEETAKKLISMPEKIRHPMDAAQKVVRDTVKSAATTVKNAFVNPLICGKTVVSGITDIIPNTIDKASMAVDKLSAALSNLSGMVDNFFNGMGGREIPGYPNLFGPFEVLYAIVIIKIQNVINKVVLGENADQILGDPKMDPKGLLDQLLKNSEKYKLAANSKEFQNIFKDWLTNYVEAVMLALNVAQEPIDRVKDKIISMVTTAGNQIGNSVQTALSSVITLGLAAIPGVGLVIDAAYTGERVGKKIMEACAKPVEAVAGSILPTANKINKGIDYTKCRINELTESLAPLMKSSQAGGGCGGDICYSGGADSKAKRKRAMKATRRVQRLLGQFTRRRVMETNYAKRLSKLRKY